MTTPERQDRALSASLRRLGRDKVDLYQLHGRTHPATPAKRSLIAYDH
jgi:aryl-alcohol dehydrogenase-like predicted oxidoreductase